MAIKVDGGGKLSGRRNVLNFEHCPSEGLQVKTMDFAKELASSVAPVDPNFALCIDHRGPLSALGDVFFAVDLDRGLLHSKVLKSRK